MLSRFFSGLVVRLLALLVFALGFAAALVVLWIGGRLIDALDG